MLPGVFAGASQQWEHVARPGAMPTRRNGINARAFAEFLPQRVRDGNVPRRSVFCFSVCLSPGRFKAASKPSLQVLLMGRDASVHPAPPLGKYSLNIREFFTNIPRHLSMVLKKVSIVNDELFVSYPDCVSADMQQFLTILRSYLEYLLPLESCEFSLPLGAAETSCGEYLASGKLWDLARCCGHQRKA
jgi:hypothetical protein